MANTDINTMNRAEIQQGVAEYFGVAAEDVTRAFSTGQTNHLRSILATGLAGRINEKLFLMTGTAVTGLAIAMIEPRPLSMAFGAAATLGLYGVQRFSRWRMDQSFHHALSVLEHGRPRQG